MKIRLLISLTTLLSLSACIVFGVNMGQYDTPHYTIEKTQKPFEIRAYPPLLVAEVTTTGSREDAINAGFRMLADFIFGNNTTQSAVDMTTPVIQQPAQIAMTTPVIQQSASGNSEQETKAKAQASEWVTRFTMPHRYTLQNLPKPNNDKIRIFETPSVRYATIRFSGFTTPSRIKEHEDKLILWLRENQIKYTSPPVYAFYNPPFTIPFLRRNEIWFALPEK